MGGIEGFLFAFSELMEELGFFEIRFELGFAFGLEASEFGHVFFEAAIGAGGVGGEEQDLFGAAHEGGGFAERYVGLGGAGIDLIFRVGVAEREDAVLYGMDAVETPVIVGDEIGDLEFEGAVGVRRARMGLQNSSCSRRLSSVMMVTWPVRP